MNAPTTHAPIVAPPFSQKRVVELAELFESEFQARTVRPAEDIQQIAASFKIQGQLQPLTVRTRSRRYRGFEVLDGETRRLAAELLQQRGEWHGTLEVIVRDDLSDAQARALSISSNLHRFEMHPMDTVQAIFDLIKEGYDESQAANTLGKTVDQIRLILFLAQHLHEKAKEAFRQNTITLEQAKAFTYGTSKQQTKILPLVVSNSNRYNHAAIKRLFVEDKIPFSRAIFPIQKYLEQGGNTTVSLFVDSGDNQFFNDRALFTRLQREAVELLLERFIERGQKAELVQRHEFKGYEHQPTTPEDPEGVFFVVWDETTLEVKVPTVPAITAKQFKQRQQKAEQEAKAEKIVELQEKAKNGDTYAKWRLEHETKDQARAPYTQAFVQRVRLERSSTLQAKAYLTDGKFALVVTVMGLLGVREFHVNAQANDINDKTRTVQHSRLIQEKWGQLTTIAATLNTSDPSLKASAASEDVFAELMSLEQTDLIRLLTDLTFDRVGDWNQINSVQHTEVTPLTARIAAHLEPEFSPAWLLTEEALKMVNRSKLADWLKSLEMPVSDKETRKDLIARLLLQKERLIREAWYPFELKFESAAKTKLELPTSAPQLEEAAD